mgnify:CR=1 FL=1
MRMPAHLLPGGGASGRWVLFSRTAGVQRCAPKFCRWLPQAGGSSASTQRKLVMQTSRKDEPAAQLIIASIGGRRSVL